jgi:hypothetical protein
MLQTSLNTPWLALVELQLRVVGAVRFAVVLRQSDLAKRREQLGRQVDRLERYDGGRLSLLLRRGRAARLLFLQRRHSAIACCVV